MYSIQFKVEQSREWDHKVLNIYIDGEDIVELIKKFEEQFDSEIAGKYEGLNIKLITNIYNHFLGNTKENDHFDYNGKTQILGCNCGEPGCWPFVVKISDENEIITWKEFEQPHRREWAAGGYWNYSDLKPIQFIKKEYEEQLKKICRKIEEDGNSI